MLLRRAGLSALAGLSCKTFIMFSIFLYKRVLKFYISFCIVLAFNIADASSCSE